MTTTKDDKWSSGVAYEAYMGRWSRMVARPFVEWLGVVSGASWLEIGCGTGALTSAVCEVGRPASVVACDQAAPFIEHTRRHVQDPRVSFVAAGVEELPGELRNFDAVVSGLVLNFIPNPGSALASMRERAASRAVVAAYVWDYAGGFEFLKRFWAEAVALDPRAASFDEGPRFPLCHAPALAALFEQAGLSNVETVPLDMVTTFVSFDDYWAPFLGGTGPAPAYVTSLAEEQRTALEARLRERMPIEGDGSIRLPARAWGVRGLVA
jgi:SAM-dependent methyltransferase